MPKPTAIDFNEVAEGVRRNNVGVDGMTLWVHARLEGSTLVVAQTGQRLELAAPPPAGAPGGEVERRVDVTGFDDAALQLRLVAPQ